MPDENQNEVENLETYMARLDALRPQFEGRRVILSTEIDVRSIVQGRIEKVPIAWPLHLQKMFYLVTVPPDTHVPRHSHDEDVFRLIIRGALILTTDEGSAEITEGMWFVVREGTEYEIESRTGYHCLSNYSHSCKPPKMGGD